MSVAPETDIPLSQTNAMRDILKWSKKRPAWQRDALRRLNKAAELTTADIDEIENICLGDVAKFIPYSDEHVAPEGEEGEPVSLVRIFNPKGINALADDQELSLVSVGRVFGTNRALN